MLGLALDGAFGIRGGSAGARRERIGEHGGGDGKNQGVSVGKTEGVQTHLLPPTRKSFFCPSTGQYPSSPAHLPPRAPMAGDLSHPLMPPGQGANPGVCGHRYPKPGSRGMEKMWAALCVRCITAFIHERPLSSSVCCSSSKKSLLQLGKRWEKKNPMRSLGQMSRGQPGPGLGLDVSSSMWLTVLFCLSSAPSQLFSAASRKQESTW